MRWAWLIVLLAGCTGTAAPYCELETSTRAICGEGYIALCSGGVLPGSCEELRDGTTPALCDADMIPFCENGAEPFCEPLPDCP